MVSKIKELCLIRGSRQLLEQSLNAALSQYSEKAQTDVFVATDNNDMAWTLFEFKKDDPMFQ